METLTLNVHKYSEDKTVDSKSFKFSKLKTEDFSLIERKQGEEVERKKRIWRRSTKRTRTRERKEKAKMTDHSGLDGSINLWMLAFSVIIFVVIIGFIN